MSTDEGGSNQTKVFAPSDVFYCVVTVANAPEDTKVKAVWTAVQVEGADPNTKIDEFELTTGSDSVFPFSLTPSGEWPVGTYKVDLFLNDKLDRTLEFSVQ